MPAKIGIQWAAEVSKTRPNLLRQAATMRKAFALNGRSKHFPDLTEGGIQARKATLRGDGTRGRWRSPPRQPHHRRSGASRYSKITVRDIQMALAPIWAQEPVSGGRRRSPDAALIFTKGKVDVASTADPSTVEPRGESCPIFCV